MVLFLVLLLLIILPGYVLGKYIYEKDIDKEPKKLLRKIIIFGALSIIPAVILELIFENLFSYENTFFSYMIYFTIGVALIEEFCKFLPVYFIGVKSNFFDDIYDAIVYTAFSALGFATVENFFYVLAEDGGIGIAIARLIFSVPGHIGYGVIMGYFLGVAYNAKSKNKTFSFYKNLLLSLLVPSLFHGVYDAVLVYGGDNFNLAGMLLVFAVDLYITIYAFKQAKAISKENEKIDTEKIIDKVGVRFIITACISILLCGLVCNTEFLNWDEFLDDESETEYEEYDNNNENKNSIKESQKENTSKNNEINTKNDNNNSNNMYTHSIDDYKESEGYKRAIENLKSRNKK